MTLNQIQARMAQLLKKFGVVAEVTFINVASFSVLVEDAGQFEAAKRVLAKVTNCRLESQDVDPECGCVAYYSM